MSKKKRNKGNNIQGSPLSSHKREGKLLSPPLASLNVQPSAWQNDRLPEMLWAALLVAQLDRDHALKIFRLVGNLIYELRTDVSLSEPPYLVTHSAIEKLPTDVQGKLLRTIVADSECKQALQPLMLLKELPAREAWGKILGSNPPPNAWENLSITIAKTLYHQTQEATDVRWLILICLILSGKLQVPREFRDEYLGYPNVGEMRKVRPSIRAAELIVLELPGIATDWPTAFWRQCQEDTSCFPFPSESDFAIAVGTTINQLTMVYNSLVEHFHRTISSTTTDPKHDTVFGIGLYCLSVLHELMRPGASHGITARLALRTVAECVITLSYLQHKNDPMLWQSYRVFGAGQAKLQCLKLDEMEWSPSYVDIESLRQLANEDIWEELLSIDIGHWANSDLRKLSIEANVKMVYDQYYAWTSSFSHGHWGSIRETVFDTCGNPLHRLHRIPRPSARMLPDVLPDACGLADTIMIIIDKLYPDFPHRVSIPT